MVNNVNAGFDYYNHIQNPSFIQYSDYIEYGGFENNAFDEGVIYGNWTKFGGDPAFSLLKSHTGQYSMFFWESDADAVIYNFTDAYEILGSDIIQISLWYWQDTNNDLEYRFYYADATFSGIYNPVGSIETWAYIDITSDVSISKILDYIWISTTSDDIYILTMLLYWLMMVVDKTV